MNSYKGKLLISDPNMIDPNFKRSVILVTNHDKKESVGLILNQPTQVKINDVIDNFPSFNASIYIGGPVQKNTLCFIHSLKDKIKESHYIGNDLYWSGDFQTLKKIIIQQKIHKNQVRFFAGYSGWGAGQLEMEINEESWIIESYNSKLILQDNNKLWHSFISKMNKKYSFWINMPEDPSLN